MPVGPIARLVMVSAVLSLNVACSRTDGEHAAAGKATAPSEPLRICAGTSYSILLPIAAQKGLFAREGLNVELKQYAIGRDAMEAMLAGNCDVATTADTPVADYGITRNDLRVIAGIAKSDSLNCIVAAKDSEIRRAIDLKGHTIGVTKGTAPHFFLDILLNKNGLTEKDITLRFMKGEELNKAVADGRLDAIATTDLNAYKLKEHHGESIRLVIDPGIVLNHGYLSVLDPTLAKRKGDLKRMLAALKSAEKLAAENPDEAAQLFTEYLKVSPAVSSQLWRNITPKLSLDSAMVLTLEDNARWLREREGMQPANKSFKDIIRPELLREVSPESVGY